MSSFQRTLQLKHLFIRNSVNKPNGIHVSSIFRHQLSLLKYRNFSTYHDQYNNESSRFFRRRIRKRGRFSRRLTLFSILFAIWFFKMDADFVTYFLDLYRSKYEHKINRKLFNSDFRNKTIWIIGSSSGIGEYLAYNLCLSKSFPQRIILSARREKQLIRVANECNKINPQIEIIIKVLDITDFSDSDSDFNSETVCDKYISDLFNEIDDDIDILILNSGILQKTRAEYGSIKSYKKLSEINIFGPIAVSQSIIKQWRYRGYTKKNKKKLHQIAVTSSMVGKMGCPGYAFYSVTKHGINGWFETLRNEIIDDNIGFNIMCLGPIMPSAYQNPEMSGINDKITYIRNYTDKYGNIIEMDRCAQLYTTALKYNLSESWITVNPYLFYMYGRQYMPIVSLWAAKYFAKSFTREVQQAEKNAIP